MISSQKYKSCVAVGPRQTIISIYIDFFILGMSDLFLTPPFLFYTPLYNVKTNCFVLYSDIVICSLIDAVFDILYDILSASCEIFPERPG